MENVVHSVHCTRKQTMEVQLVVLPPFCITDVIHVLNTHAAEINGDVVIQKSAQVPMAKLVEVKEAICKPLHVDWMIDA